MNSAKNILLYMFVYPYVTLVGYMLRCGITELRVNVCFNVSRFLSNISKMVGPTYTTTSTVHEEFLSAPHSHKHLVLSIF